jgi:hypothetical protein
MKSVIVRFALLLLFLAASAATGYFIWTSETNVNATAGTARRFDLDAMSAERALIELRASQQAYVAAGQGEPFWIAKVGAATSDLKALIGAIRVHATTPLAQTSVDTAFAVLQDFEQMDRRARDYARTGQRLMASDLIFSDGLELTTAAVNALEEARAADRQAHEQGIREIRRAQLIVLGSFAALAVLVVGLLVPLKNDKAAGSQSSVAPPAVADHVSNADSLDLSLALDRTADTEPAEDRAGAVETIDLDSVATLCTDLARVVDTRALPSILERTAAILDASGIVLWIADPDGRELTPIVAHGYSPQLVNRLGTIVRDAQNVTASAFRTGLMQTVMADAVSDGAIAAPLVTPGGTVGVMAAEVRGGGERQTAKLAATSIVAAQLATLVGPPVSRGQSKQVAGA